MVYMVSRAETAKTNAWIEKECVQFGLEPENLLG